MNTIVFHGELTVETAVDFINKVNQRKLALAPLNMLGNFNIYMSGYGNCIHARSLLTDYFSFDMGNTLVSFGNIEGTLLEVFLRSMVNDTGMSTSGGLPAWM